MLLARLLHKNRKISDDFGSLTRQVVSSSISMGHMWYKEKNKNPIVSLTLLLALVTTPMLTSFLKSDYVLARGGTETPSFPLPSAVPEGTKIRLDGSTSMTRTNEALKERFEKEYSGAEVKLASNGTNEALKALQEGKIEIAAIGRGLTPDEEKLGLAQQRLRREKIAIIVGKDNPFKGNLTNKQFAQIYRGEINDWSQLGGRSGKIRVIDLPDSSDTRRAFGNYPVFKGNLFRTGSTATQLDSDDPAEVVKELGNDGIGFVLANQVSKLDNVRVLKMHKTLPDDPRYPYSQPLVYVFKKNPSEAVKNFVGFATAAPGKEALEKAREEEAKAVAATVARSVSGDGNATEGGTPQTTSTPGSTEAATSDAKTTTGGNETAQSGATSDSKTANAGNENAGVGAGNENGETATNGAEAPGVATATNTSASGETASGDQAFLPGESAGASNEATVGTIPWWWFLLPVAALGALILWWLLGRRKSQEDDTIARGVLPDNAPPPFTPTSTSTSGAVKEPVANQPVEPTAGINTTTVEAAANTAENNPGINAAGIAAGIAGVGLGAAALSSQNQEDTPEVSEKSVAETASELHLNAPSLQQPDISSVEVPDLQQPDIPDTGLDLEAPAAVVNNSYPPIPLISNQTDGEAPPTEENHPTELGLENSPQEELPKPTSSNNWLGNFTLGAAAGAERIKSKLTAKDTPESAASETLSQENSPQVNQSATDETVSDAELEVNARTEYPQLPDVWETPETEPPTSDEQVNSNSSFSLDGAASAAAGLAGGAAALGSRLFNRDDVGNNPQENNNPESQPQETQETTQSDLWGTADTEPPENNKLENSSFSLGSAAAAAAGLAGGAAALGSRLFNQENEETDDISNNTEESTNPESQAQVTQEATQSDLWATSTTERSPKSDSEPQVIEETSSVSNPDLPEVRITTSNEQSADSQETPPQKQPQSNGLPNVWVTPSHSQSTTAQDEGNPASSVVGAVLAGGAALASGMLGGNQESQKLDENSTDEDVALDKIADEAEADTNILASEQNSDVGETLEDKIDGNQHHEDTESPNESYILLASRTPKWAYASWNITAADREAMQNLGGTQLVLRLYDSTDLDLSYQSAKLVQQYECEEIVNHRYVAIPNTDRDYIAEIGYVSKDKDWLLVSRSPIVRVFNRPQKDFWFEADAELIIHGATEPGSTVTIGGQNIKVKQDGTFHLRVPFTESLIEYLITAVSEDSEKARTIHMQFQQSERKNS